MEADYSVHPYNDPEEQAHFKNVVSAYFNYTVMSSNNNKYYHFS